MKITIELTEAEVRGLKEYLKEISPDIDPSITKEDIKQEIRGILDSALQSGAVYDYIQKHSA